MIVHLSENKFLLMAVFLMGITSGLFLHKTGVFKESAAVYYKLKHLYRSGTHIVNPLIQVEGPPGGDVELESTKRSLEIYIHRCLKNNEAFSLSVYLRNLDEGTWVGINEDETFTAASLAKVPILLTFFMKAQQDPSILNKKITYETEMDAAVHQAIVPKDRLQVGSIYTVEELLHHMIAYSDNTPVLLLSNEIDDKFYEKTFSDLQLPIMRRTSKEYHLSAKSYASCFRILYSASYLNKDLSEKALNLLTEADFRDGLVAGVPKDIPIAHKFGERDAWIEGVQLHDCGIVYYPGSPYLICVMTKGWDLETLKKEIKDISKIVYEHKSLGKSSIVAPPQAWETSGN